MEEGGEKNTMKEVQKVDKIVLWRLGSLEHNIMPTQEALTTLRKILKDNIKDESIVNLVWGPELDMVSLNVDVHVEQIFDYDSIPDKIAELEKKIQIYKELQRKLEEDKNEKNSDSN